MATLIELVTLFSNDVLKNRITAAAIITAQATLADATAPAGRRTWAAACLTDTASTVDMLMKYVIAANNELEAAAIVGASEAAVKTAVNAAIDAVYPAEVV